MISGIKETCLYVEDIKRSVNFYKNTLGFNLINESSDRHAFFRIQNQILLLFNPAVTANEKVLPPHFATGHQHIAFEVPHSEYEKFKETLSTKLEITYEHYWRKEFYSFYFEDPDKNVLEVVPSGLWDY